MADTNVFEGVFDDVDEFDPLLASDDDIDQEDMDDDNPYDTVDYPTMRNMPQHMTRDAVYTPQTQGSAKAALENLFDHNPARRPVLLAIIDACRNGAASSTITDLVDKVQQDNKSVYAPMTLCRMLERAGGLELHTPDVAEAQEDMTTAEAYLTIQSTPDPIWTSTAAALKVWEEQTQGAEFKRIVLGKDAKYLSVYKAVLALIDEEPRSRTQIGELVDTFPIVMEPRRFGEHFIDMLERTDAITWHDHAWTITDLGRDMLKQLKEN